MSNKKLGRGVAMVGAGMSKFGAFPEKNRNRTAIWVILLAIRYLFCIMIHHMLLSVIECLHSDSQWDFFRFVAFPLLPHL